MPLPTGFSNWEHLQDTVRKAVNQQIRQEFSDIELDDDISTARGSLKVACLHDDKDNGFMTLIRLILYYVVVKSYGIPEIYSVPISSVNEGLRYKPQIHLHFAESARLIRDGETPVDSQIKFRLMTQTTETLSESEARQYAQKIKTLFGSGSGFTWARGKNMFTYSDGSKGYNMQLLVQTENEGKRIVEQVLDIQSHTPDWKFANYKQNLEPTEAFPNSPPNKLVLGKSTRAKRRRPVTTLQFRYALLHVEGLPKPKVLYDKTGFYKNAYLRD